MATVSKIKKPVRFKSRRKSKVTSNVEVLQQIVADQKFIREAIQSGVTFQELKDKYGYKFATV